MTTQSLIMWRVRMVNRQTKELSDRDLILDAGSVTPAEMTEIESILDDFSRRHEIVKFRSHFKERGEPTKECEDKADRTHAFSLTEYFEDEAANPLSNFGLMKVLMGSEHIIVDGDIESALAMGTQPIRNPTDWNVEKANILSHFLEIAHCLAQSPWLKAKASITSVGIQGGQFTVIDHQRPNVLLVTSVLPFVRQLAFNDKLFEKAVDAYKHHAANGKQVWIGLQKLRFDRILDSTHMLPGTQITGGKLLNLFCYAFGLMHTPRPEQILEFKQMVAQHRQEKLTLAFNMMMQHIVAESQNTAVVIAHDLHRWCAEGAVKPDRINITDVLDGV